MQKAFNFKLLVPPRAHLSQVSAVKPRETSMFEENGIFSPSNQSSNKYSDTETSVAFPSKMVLPMKTARTEGMKKAAVMPMEKEEMPLRSSQLYSRLLDEAEKIRLWKFRMDSDIAQKDRKLQENRKIIETQRKAIQELQFANESLSMKLEDQLNENEDLRNKSNATRNLCNILKDTFERSAEKMSLFEAEREEAHELFIQNSEDIQKMVAAFESLRKQAEANQQDMLKLRECLKQSEDLQVKLESECHVKEKEVAMLQEEIQDVSLKLQETQQTCSLLEKSARKRQELLQSVTQDREVLEDKLKMAEQLKLEIEENQKTLTYKLEQSNENHEKILQKKTSELEKLSNIKEQQSNQLAEMQLKVNSLQSSLTFEIQRTQDLETKITSVVNELSDKNAELEVIKGQKEECSKQMQILRDELDEKSNSLLSVKEELKTGHDQMLQLIVSLKENQSLRQHEINNLKGAMESVAIENVNLTEILTKARCDNEVLQEEAVLKEAKLKEVEEQLSEALESCCKSSNVVEGLEREIQQQKEKYNALVLKCNDLQIEKDAIQQQVDSGALEKKDLEAHLMKSNANAEMEKTEIERLEMEKKQLREQVDILTERITEQDEECRNVQDQLRQSAKGTKRELQRKDSQMKALDSKISNLKTKLETKTKAHEECLEEIHKLKEDLDSIQKHKEEELQKVRFDFENKSTSESQLSLEVQKLKQTAMEALKSKEDTESKCQQKISDMVALMEKHKHEYDKMVEEKDAELNEKRMREAEVNASKASMELELSHLQVENNELRQQLEKKAQNEAVKTPVSSLEKDTLHQISDIKPKKGRNRISKTQKADTTKKNVFDLLNEEEKENSPSRSSSDTPVGDIHEVLHNPIRSLSKTIGTTPQIKSFRIRTPPTPEITGSWKKNILKLDPKSDNSDSNDILSFSPRPVKSKRPMQPRDPQAESLNMLKKVQSSFMNKSPGEALKVAAMKRMREAGWTTVSHSDKKKKRVKDKIFA